MLPAVDCSLKLPSLHDSIELNCRIYFPRHGKDIDGTSLSGFAIFAHPYAPFGGSYDDPIVQDAGSVLLKQGFVLCTFNFRGASGSSGSTSWTGKPELADFVTIYTFVIHLLGSADVVEHIEWRRTQPFLLLGGYSYGSMMAAHLPEYGVIKSMCSHVQDGSPDYDIQQRAHETAKVLIDFLESQTQRGRSSLLSDDASDVPNARREVMMGGYGSEHGSQQSRRNSARRSIDVPVIRRSIDRVKHKLSSRAIDTEITHQDLQSDRHASSSSLLTIDPLIGYILISPLLQIVAGLTTVFSRLTFERRIGTHKFEASKTTSQTLSENPTLAVYGDRDVFTSSRKLKRWAQELQDVPGSCFRAEEVTGAGHFWHELGAHESLSQIIRSWVSALVVRSDRNKGQA